MTPVPHLTIWRHQWQRVARFGSAADLVVSMTLRGSILIASLLLGAAVLLVPRMGGAADVAAKAVSATLETNALVFLICVFLLNLWASAHGSVDLRGYRSYPLSLSWIAIVTLVVRMLHVRYVTGGLLVVCLTGIVLGSTSIWHAAAACLLVLSLDSASVLVQALQGRRPGISYAIIAALFVVGLNDLRAGHTPSRHVYDAWIRSAGGMSVPFGVLCATSVAFAAAAVLAIRTQIRYEG